MAHILKLTCPVDDLLFDVSFLDRISDELAGFDVGEQIQFAVDSTIMCPNGHFWAMNIDVVFSRLA